MIYWLVCVECVQIYLFLLLQGVVDVLCEACEKLSWKIPSKIQREAIPVAIEGEIHVS